MTEALRQIEPYKVKTKNVPMKPMRDDNGKVIKEVTVPWIDVLSDLEGNRPQDLYKLGVPTNGQYYYPVDKRRTKGNHEAMQRAEQHLDIFWKQADSTAEIRRQWKLDHLKKCDECCDCGVDSAVRRLLTSGTRCVQRTGGWVEPVVNQRVGTKNIKTNEVLLGPLSEVYFDLERRTEATIGANHRHSHQHHGHSHAHSHQHDHVKPKAKTRGLAGKENVPPTTRSDQSSSAKPDVQPIFELDARAIKVFRTIFFTPSATSTPGEVTWADFLHAMAATGFKAEKLYGSVWNFSPSTLDIERSIQIHEPHPSGKIPYRTCRRHGRRLNKAYGWHGDMFMLADEAKQPLAAVNGN